MSMKTLLILTLLGITNAGAQGLISTPTPTPTPTPMPLADVRAQAIRAAFQQAAVYNLAAYRTIRTALMNNKAATLASLGVTEDQLLSIAAALRQAMALTDSSLATQFDAITAATSPTPSPSP